MSPKGFEYKHLPSFLKSHRERLKVSQAEFAEKIGMAFHGAPQFMSNLERGRCTLPMQYWKQTAKYLKIPITEIADEYIKDERLKIKTFFQC